MNISVLRCPKCARYWPANFGNEKCPYCDLKLQFQKRWLIAKEPPAFPLIVKACHPCQKDWEIFFENDGCPFCSSKLDIEIIYVSKEWHDQLNTELNTTHSKVLAELDKINLELSVLPLVNRQKQLIEEMKALVNYVKSMNS